MLDTVAYLAGEWVDAQGGRTFAVQNPARGDVIAEVADIGRAQLRHAIAAAEAAQKAWAARTAKERANILRKWFDLMVANADDLATILTAEQGKPLAEARGEILYGASFVEWFAEEAKRIYGETIPGHMPDKRLTVLRQPIGVAAAITPWNFPNAMITRKVAPALAAGCAIIVRPATLTPLSALALGVLADRAGLPKGILSIVPSKSSSEIGKEFCENPIIRKLTFTGSTEDAAVEGAIACKFRNNGQTCVCANRIYVQDGVYDAFAQKLATRLGKMKVGDGLEGADLGPLIDGAAVEKVREHIADATSKGATVFYGGSAHDLGGTFFQPTIVTGVTQDMMVATDETFGPLAPLFRFSTEEEVIAMANDTIFGLASYFYARDIGRITRVSEALEYGIVGINTGIISTEVAPFGGVKQSGLGREGSRHGIEDYLEMKYVCLSV